jgi:hypothetical protein
MIALAKVKKLSQKFHTIRRSRDQGSSKMWVYIMKFWKKRNYHTHNFWCHRCVLRILGFSKHGYIFFWKITLPNRRTQMVPFAPLYNLYTDIFIYIDMKCSTLAKEQRIKLWCSNLHPWWSHNWI